MAKKKKEATKKSKTEEALVEEEQEKERVTKKKIKVNLWRTRLHGEEIGIYQSLKYRAKTRLFAKDFDIEGVVEIDGEKEWIIAYNKDKWHKAKKDDPAKARLLLRMFTILEEKMGVGKGGNFVGGIELSITHSLVQSFEVRRPSPVFFVHLPRSPNLIRIVRGWRLKGTRWTWPLLPQKKGDQFQMVKAKGTIGLGRDYDIYLGKVKVARIDMQRIEKDVEIEIYDEEVANDEEFCSILALFGAICFFMKDCEDIIEDFYKPMKETGTTDYKIPRYEDILFRNPRFIGRK